MPYFIVIAKVVKMPVYMLTMLCIAAHCEFVDLLFAPFSIWKFHLQYTTIDWLSVSVGFINISRLVYSI